MTVLGSGESGMEEGNRLRLGSTGERRGSPELGRSLEHDRCLNAHGILMVDKKRCESIS